MSGPHEPPPKGWGALRWGFLVGATGPVVVSLSLWALLELWTPGLSAPEFNVEVVSAGREVTRHAGEIVIIAHERGSVTQTCRGGCDDLRLWESSGDNAHRVRVLNHAGRCVACSSGEYVAGGYGASVTHLRVRGEGALDIRSALGERPASSITTQGRAPRMDTAKPH